MGRFQRLNLLPVPGAHTLPAWCDPSPKAGLHDTHPASLPPPAKPVDVRRLKHIDSNVERAVGKHWLGTAGSGHRYDGDTIGRLVWVHSIWISRWGCGLDALRGGRKVLSLDDVWVS